MPITITGDRDRNTVDAPPELLAGAKGLIHFKGSGSKVSIGEGCSVSSGLHFTIGGDSEIAIGRRCVIGQLTLFIRDGTSIRIGDRVGFNGSVRMMAHENAGITVGDRSLIAGNVTITASDMHSIIDVGTGRRINPSKAVVVGEHVWIGTHASLLKGASIGSDSVIGAHSVVSGEIPANCIAAGVPARVIRYGVNWARELLPIDSDPIP